MAKTTRKRSYKKRSKVGSTPKATRKIGGKTFKRKSCHTSKSAAQKAAKAIRGRGMTARVIGGCVYQGPKAKK